MSPPGDRLPARHLSADYRSTAHAQPQSRLDVVGRFASMFAEGERRGATTHSARWSPPANACKTLVKCLHGPTPYYSSVKRGCAGPLQSILQAFLRTDRDISLRPRGRRCLADHHLRTWCPPNKPPRASSGLGDPGSNPGGATHSGTHRTRPPERSSGGRLFPPPSLLTTSQNMHP